jgi:hypothetical protein
VHGTRASAFGRGQGVCVRASQGKPGQARKRTNYSGQPRSAREGSPSPPVQRKLPGRGRRDSSTHGHSRSSDRSPARSLMGLADRGESESLPRAPSRVRFAAHRDGWPRRGGRERAIPSACGNAAHGRHNVTSQQPLPVAASAFSLCLGRVAALARPTDRSGHGEGPRTGQPELAAE